MSFLCFQPQTGSSSCWLIRYLQVVNRDCSNAFCIYLFHLSRHRIFNYVFYRMLQNCSEPLTKFKWTSNEIKAGEGGVLREVCLKELFTDFFSWIPTSLRILELHATDSVMFEDLLLEAGELRVNYSAVFFNFCFSKLILMKHI